MTFAEIKNKILKIVPDKLYLIMRYRSRFGRKPDLQNPVTFNEKIQWLKLYDRKPLYTQMVDKYEAKKFVAEKAGSEYVIPTLGVWDHFDEIDFDSLPDRFVLKCTHDSGGVVICRNKESFDMEAGKKKINKSLSRNFYWIGREWPYKNVKPRIIAEAYLEDLNNRDLKDYKIFCFNGKPEFCQVIVDRSSNETIDFFDMNWVHQEFTGLGFPHKPHSSSVIQKPANFQKMKKLAAFFSKNIPFLRMDFYEVQGKLYFGEFTFYPADGFGSFYPEEWNTKTGNMLSIDSLMVDR
ncbi:MAG: ATP-grasp fold amidoligase family protein [Lachnospiraceae bacterium]|nr:ATP-grasp fold amidoligase family protein [Lachnospiraceae bacterium]